MQWLLLIKQANHFPYWLKKLFKHYVNSFLIIILTIGVSFFLNPVDVSGEFPIQLKTKTRQIAEDLQDEVAQLAEQLNRLQNDLEVLKISDKRITTIEKQLKGTEADLKDDLRNRIESFEVGQSNRLSVLEKQIEDIKSELSSFQSNIHTDLKKNLTSLDESIRSFEKTSEDYRNTFQLEIKKQLSEQDSSIALQLSKISDKLKDKNDEISLITTTIEKNAKERRTELTALESTITASTKSLAEESNKNLSFISDISKELAGKNNEINSLKSSLSRVEENLVAKDVELSNLKTFIREKGSDIENLESIIIKSVEEANNQTLDFLSTISKDLDKKANDIASLKKALNNLEQRTTLLADKISEKETSNETASLKKTIETLEKKVDILTSKLTQQDNAVKGKPTSTEKKTIEQETPDSEALYSEAIKTVKNKDFLLALDKFQHFLTIYPDTSLSDNAQYWIGEIYFALQSYDKAISEFEKVVTNFPESNKVPDSIYMQGQAFQKLNDKPKARSLLNKVIKDFPTHQAATKATVILKEIGE